MPIRTPFALGAALVMLAASATPGVTQGSYTITVERSPGWLGISYDTRWVLHGEACQPQVVVDAVIHGSPAERAGIRAGDAILALDGRPLEDARLERLTARLRPGDSISLRIARAGRVHDLVAVAGERPVRPPKVITDPRAERELFARSRAPVVSFEGDTLVARNVQLARYNPRRTGGFWLVRDGERTDFRRYDPRRSEGLDRRVARLLACADSISRQPTRNPVVVNRVALREVQDRADSLRRLLAERAMTRSESEPLEVTLDAFTRESAEAAGSWTVHADGDGTTSVVRFDHHVLLADRGVAGAEVVAMEPELASYFRNVRDGLLVLRVAEDTPAERAGMEPGDVIVAGDGRRIESVSQLRRLFTLPDASPVQVRVIRHGRDRTLLIPRR